MIGIAPGTLVADDGGTGWGHMGDGWGMGGAGGWMMLVWVVVWVVVLGLIVWGVVALTRSGRRDDGAAPPTPTEVLEMRFARGEITDEEYRRARETLEDRRNDGR
ncbi:MULTISPECIES: SHOCT domain-containing protein [unclassified Isoptericola]|uniref:SHOCT domain-containing protein n=1 Tax=unclassified Isoptericola TaxID=2623355 RepID=UPI00271423B5|nr:MULTISPECIES: SHOCT domain-containing protein [unclassified Isoptericola]MDO8143413.1 SHOCT domain-containing protein [Isoptericola sp. 178]MDO8147276.1 SHOCT domain-containing protein [Isoptericola sp. b515]MDO8150411.1 SHOCT domain-containing protein [Isoptericola sp. b408]